MNKRELLNTIKILFTYDFIYFERVIFGSSKELVNVRIKGTNEILFNTILSIKDIIFLKEYLSLDSCNDLFSKF